MLLETIGIGLIIPFMQALITEGVNKDIAEFLNIFKIFPKSKSNLILILILILATAYTFKASFLTYFSYIQTKLLVDLKVSLSDRLYSIYLNKPYSFHLNNNSSKLIRNVNEIDIIVYVIRTLILLINEIVVFLGISIFIILYEPVGSLTVILFLGAIGYLFFKTVQTRAKAWGETRQIHAGLSLKYLQEGFGSIKDIKILQRSDELIKNFTSNNKIINLSEFKKDFIDSLPRLWLEWLVVIGFFLLIFVLTFQGKELFYIVPILGLFAAAAYRIMPSLTRIMNAIQGLIYNHTVVDTVYREFNVKNLQSNINKIKKSKEIFLDKEINLKNINFKYSDTAPFILKDISMSIKKGTTVGLIGESGIGKTTLINMILGLVEPSTGKVEIDGVNIFENVESWQKNIGYVPQNVYLSDDTIKKNIAFALPDNKIDYNAVKKAATNAQLDNLIANSTNGLDTKVGEFGDRISGGQRQRIAIARALYKDPKILILDECTNSLDLETEKQIINEVNFLKGKKTIIMITHRLSTLENCDQIYKIDKGGLKIQTI